MVAGAQTYPAAFAGAASGCIAGRTHLRVCHTASSARDRSHAERIQAAADAARAGRMQAHWRI